MTSPLRRNRPITASAAPTATTPPAKRWLAALACSLALPLAAAGQTPPTVPVAQPIPGRESLPSPSSLYGTWQGDRFIPHPVHFQDEKPKLESQPGKNELDIQLEPPSREQLFQLKGERSLEKEVVEYYQRTENRTVTFPVTGVLAPPGVFYQKPVMPPARTEVVPSYLCHHPLYFEEKNSERYGWEMGIWQPFISAGTFYKDLAFLPYKMGLDHPLSCVTNVGKWQPGDCVPYILYVTPFTWKGAALESATVIGGGAVWP
jgi:hypothetical protein